MIVPSVVVICPALVVPRYTQRHARPDRVRRQPIRVSQEASRQSRQSCRRQCHLINRRLIEDVIESIRISISYVPSRCRRIRQCVLADQRNPLADPRDTSPRSTALRSPSGSGSCRVLPALLRRSQTPSPSPHRYSGMSLVVDLHIQLQRVAGHNRGRSRSNAEYPGRCPAQILGSYSPPALVSDQVPSRPQNDQEPGAFPGRVRPAGPRFIPVHASKSPEQSAKLMIMDGVGPKAEELGNNPSVA